MAIIYISHSSRDQQAALDLGKWLRSQGFDQTFSHFDLTPGTNWERKTYEEVTAAEAVLLVLTQSWLDSKWCFAEYALARALGKAIFPLIYGPMSNSVATDIQAIDLNRDRDHGFELLASALTRIALGAQGGFTWDITRSPFPGLLAFDEADAAVFFARDNDIRQIIEKLHAIRAGAGTKLLTLHGASGSGKTSLLRAGVLPRLKRDKRNWIVLQPFRPGQHPIDAFAQVMADALGQASNWRSLRERILPSSGNLSGLGNDLRAACGSVHAEILICIDQGEELFNVADNVEARLFFEIIKCILGGDLPFTVIITFRSDYLDRAQNALEPTKRFGECWLPPLELDRMQLIIEGPARVAGFNFDIGVAAAAIKDVVTGYALPFLADVLRKLYDRSSSRKFIILAEYLSLGDPQHGLSPIENSICRIANEVLSQMRPTNDELQALRETLVPAMVRINADGDYVRAEIGLDQIMDKAWRLVAHLTKAHLFVIRKDNDKDVLHVVHESLLRKWPLFRGWLDADRTFLIGKQQLALDLQEWLVASDAHKTAALLSGPKLGRAETWLAARPQQLSSDELTFIQQSTEHQKRRMEQELIRSRLTSAGMELLSLANMLEKTETPDLSAHQLKAIHAIMLTLKVMDTENTSDWSVEMAELERTIENGATAV